MQFWLIATLMVIATTATLVVPLFWRTREPDAPRLTRTRRFVYATIVAALIPLAALAFYAFSGRSDLAGTRAPRADELDAATLHARAAMRGGGENGGDLDAAIDRLRARLAQNPDDADGWNLLAQSYEFQGRAEEAAEARSRAGLTPGMAAQVAATASMPAPALDSAAAGLALQAEQHRRRREFAAAVKVFAQLEKRGDMSADLWADYADALGGARGKLDGEAEQRIDRALRLDPDHPKALWLRASLHTERRDYPAAIATWQHLARVLPADSPDARIIAANLAEAREKLGAAAETPAATTVSLRGSISLDARLRDRVRDGDTLFVFARAADERGPPLAVLRTAAGPWPLRFELDDRNAMMPGRTLSSFKRVILEARISRSGNALAQPGDLRGVSAVLDPRKAATQSLTIGEEIGDAPSGGG